MACDLRDNFYLFEWGRLCEMFSLPGSITAREFCADSWTDTDGRQHDAEPNESLFECPSSLPMVSAWALHFGHDVWARDMVVAARRNGLSGAAARGQFLLEGLLAPTLSPTVSILAPYVDDFEALVRDHAAAVEYCEALSAVLGEAAQCRVSGDVDRVPLGHAVHACMVWRPGLSVLPRPYRGASWRLATGTTWRRRHIESRRNPSDADGRLADGGTIAAGQRFRGHGLDQYLERRANVPAPMRPLVPGGPAVCELFAGTSRFSASCLDHGLRVAVPLEMAAGAPHDLGGQRTQRALLSWVRAGLFWSSRAATPCTLDSMASGSVARPVAAVQERDQLIGFICR